MWIYFLIVSRYLVKARKRSVFSDKDLMNLGYFSWNARHRLRKEFLASSKEEANFNLANSLLKEAASDLAIYFLTFLCRCTKQS